MARRWGVSHSRQPKYSVAFVCSSSAIYSCVVFYGDTLRTIRPSSIFRRLLMAWFVLWGTLLSVDSTIASQNSEIEITAQMGVGGMWKVGFPAPLRLEIQSKTKQRISVRVRSVDGDGVPIVYRSEEWSW
ncbi:MAG: hypothetical protein U0905_21610, partial [Pirellulales bacterium]